MTGTGPAKHRPDVGPVLVFDSGLGGLTVFRHVIDLLPRDHLVYFVDNEGFPYGGWAENELTERIVTLIGRAIEAFAPSTIVIACNTATTIAIDALRAAYTDAGPRIPIIGTVPAIKVAAKVSQSRVFSVLATPGTVHRDYTKALIAVFAGDCDVTLVGVDQLAAISESRMLGHKIDIPHLADLIAPAFVEKDGLRTDTVVLGCTHYPLIEPELTKAGKWPVRFIDPAPAIAQRLGVVLQNAGSRPNAARIREIVFTAPARAFDGCPDLEQYGFERSTHFKF